MSSSKQIGQEFWAFQIADIHVDDLSKFVMVECNKCEYKESMGINSCYGCYLGMDGYYILPRQMLLDNPSVTNYEAMLEIFEDNNIDEIYLILS